jgi:ABC-type nickel/cobalt efflux system permease component RcnA
MLATLVTVLLIWSPASAVAHPLGNFTVNRYAGLVVSPHEVVVDYVLDLAEIPAFQELPSIDSDGDGADEEELRTWAARASERIVDGLVLEVDRRPLALRVRRASATMPVGQGGLPTLRLETTLWAPVDSAAGTLKFEDRNEPNRVGWREITATSADGVALLRPTVPAASVSEQLRAYPNDLLSSPLSVTAMGASFRPGSTTAVPTTSGFAGIVRPLTDGGALAALIGHEGVPLMLLGLAVAVAFGAWHALLPGHGKTLMAAAMVGSSARSRQAVVAGVSVAFMHTISVIALGVLVLGLERAFRPETVYPWLGVASGSAAAAIGLHLVRGRFGAWRQARAAREGASGHRHVHPEAPGHVHEIPVEGLLSRRGMAALAFAGGILPAPSALIVMLAAVQSHRVAYGLGLVLAFSFGLAVSLVAVGLGAMRAREAMDGRLSFANRHLVPLLSACAIVVVGSLLTVGGLASL